MSQNTPQVQLQESGKPDAKPRPNVIMRHRDSFIVLIGFSALLGLIIALKPFRIAIAGWAWFTLAVSLGGLLRTLGASVRDRLQGIPLTKSLHDYYDSEMIVFGLLFFASALLSYFYPFVISPVIAVLGGFILGWPLKKRPPKDS